MMYLDNAATSFPKPEAVYAATDRWLRLIGAPHGRSNYRAGGDSDDIVRDCRRQLARLLDAPSAESVCYTYSCTDSLNLLLNGFVRPGDSIITTKMEHNSVLRPLESLRKNHGIRLRLTGFDPLTGMLDVSELKSMLQADPARLFVVSHASNVTGVVQPLDEICDLCHQFGTYVLADMAQTAGHYPISLRTMNPDFAAASGHKGLLGPPGTGILYIRPGLEHLVQPTRCGGTGSQSHLLDQPSEMPNRFESGSPNLPGIAGLKASTAYLLNESVEKVHLTSCQLSRRLSDRLAKIPGVTLYAGMTDAGILLSGAKVADPAGSSANVDLSSRTAIVAFNVGSLDPREVTAILDGSFDIQCRGGIHCAPLTHEVLGTFQRGGCVRMSPGIFNSLEQMDLVADAVEQIASEFRE